MASRFTVKLPFALPFVMLSDPDEIRQVLQAPPELLHPGEGGRILEPVVGPRSLLLLDEDAHLEHRRMLLPAFHGERLKLLSGLMAELTERELDSWPTGETVALHPRLQRLTLEIILRAVFGLEQGERLDELRAALTRVLAISESPVSLMLPTVQRWAPWLGAVRRLRRLLADTDELILAQVRERREAFERAELGDVSPDVLAMLLAARHADGEPMSEHELRDELVTALVAGHETTASQLAWLFMQLAREPGVVERLQAELDAGVEDAYLTATIYEIQRLRPVLPNAMPRVATEAVRIGDWEYPAGTALLVSSWLVHHDPNAVSGALRVSTRAIHRGGAGNLYVVAVRRRPAPLHRCRVRPAGDEDRGGRRPAPVRDHGRQAGVRADRAPKHHVQPSPRSIGHTDAARPAVDGAPEDRIWVSHGTWI